MSQSLQFSVFLGEAEPQRSQINEISSEVNTHAIRFLQKIDIFHNEIDFMQKTIKKQILEYFFQFPSALISQKQIELILKLPKESTTEPLKQLEKEAYLISRIESKTIRFAINPKSNKFRIEKELYQLKWKIPSI